MRRGLSLFFRRRTRLRLIQVLGALFLLFIASSGADTYSEWKARVFTPAEQADPAISGENALSPAGDGIPNLLKYAFGMDPHEVGFFGLPQPGMVDVTDPETGEVSRFPTISYQSSATNPPTDLYYLPEWSLDMQHWLHGDALFAKATIASGANADDLDVVSFRALTPLVYPLCGEDDPCGGSTALVRLRVIEGQSLPDDWQLDNFGTLGVDPTADVDGDGRTNFEEYLRGSDPHDYYSGSGAQISVFAGDGQRGFAAYFLPHPLIALVLSSDGVPLVNAPVVFTVVSGGGAVAASESGGTSQTIEVRTDDEGRAQVSYLQPNVFGASSVVRAAIVSPTANAQTMFTCSTGAGVVIEPASIDALVNAEQPQNLTVTIGNQTSEPVGFTTQIQNGAVGSLAYTDSDRAGGPEFVWNDISATGTHLDVVSNADDDDQAVNLSFAFPYFGNSYSKIYVCSNGYVTVGKSWVQYWNVGLPSTDMPPNEIAAFHTDLDTGRSGDVYYQEFADGVVIQFSNVARYGSGDRETFQIVLKKDGTILFYYLTLSGPVEEATVGIQNETRDQGLTVAYQTQYLKNNLAVRITNATPWLGISPENGVLAAGELATLNVTLNQGGLKEGTYSGAIKVSTGAVAPPITSRTPVLLDPTTLDVSVTMNINDAPQITLETPASDALYPAGDVIRLSAFAQDANGIAAVEFYDGALKIAEVLEPPYQFDWSATSGAHVVSARARDELGAVGRSGAVSIRKDIDTDHDGLGDEWEVANFGNLNQDGAGDDDHDGLTNAQEYLAHTSPRSADSDNDGVSDAEELNTYHTNPASGDSDNDGISDRWEIDHGLSPSTNDADQDADADGLSNREEFVLGTDPLNPDTDSDGAKDGNDGFPKDPDLKPPRLPEYHYAVLDLGPGAATAINNHNMVIGNMTDTSQHHGFLWNNGVRQDLPDRGKLTFGIAINDNGVPLFSCETDSSPLGQVPRPAIWAGNQFVPIGTNIGSVYPDQVSWRRVMGWEPNIIYTGVDLARTYSAGITNDGQVALSMYGETCYAAVTRPAHFWGIVLPSPSDGNPLVLRATLDENDQDLPVNDDTYRDFFGGLRGEFYWSFGGHYDNRLGVDNIISLKAINNNHQVIGECFHYTGVNQFGFPNYDGPTRRNVTIWEDGVPFDLGSGDQVFVSALNDNGIVVGAKRLPDSTGTQILNTILWVKGAGAWKEKNMGPFGMLFSRINNNMQMIWTSWLYQNGGLIHLQDQMPVGYDNLNLFGLNEAGIMVGSVNLAADNGSYHAVLLFPVELAVDANRDGVIKFPGNAQGEDLNGHAMDGTSEDRPYRFWVNDDNDTSYAPTGEGGSLEVTEAEKVPAGRPDYSLNKIVSKRNLEDFSSLWMYFGGLHDAIRAGNIKVGLRWKSVVPGTTPAINIYASADENGSTSYLTDDGAAQQQIGGVYNEAVRDINNVQTIAFGTQFIFKNDYWTGLDSEHPKKCFLFEGAGVGKGELEIFFLDSALNVIGSGGSLWLDLKNVKTMYQSVDRASHPWPHFPLDVDPEEDKSTAVVFVHGWRLSPDGAANYAETMFKRFWHRGYKGRFAAFHWDTWWHESAEGWVPFAGRAIDAYLAHFNESEYTAWNSAGWLKAFVNALPFEHKNIVAHSMGNIVTSEALREGMKVDNYAMLNAAVPAACYDPGSHVLQRAQYYLNAGPFRFRIWDSPSPDADADAVTRSLAYRGTFQDIGANADLINFYLPNDEATSFAWEVNNDQTKPPTYNGVYHYQPEYEPARFAFHYEYNPLATAGHKLWRFGLRTTVASYFLDSQDRKFEAMAFACRTWGKAAGAFSETRGTIRVENRVDLSQSTQFGAIGFGTDHSAEFENSILQLSPFYKTLLNRLRVAQNP